MDKLPCCSCCENSCVDCATVDHARAGFNMLGQQHVFSINSCGSQDEAARTYKDNLFSTMSDVLMRVLVKTSLPNHGAQKLVG